MHAGECDDPSKLIPSDVIVIGYEDPVLEGENITFTCPTESALSGPNLTTCMGNGKWDTDLREVKCTGVQYYLQTFHYSQYSMIIMIIHFRYINNSSILPRTW